jgi:hypothetical protein
MKQGYIFVRDGSKTGIAHLMSIDPTDVITGLSVSWLGVKDWRKARVAVEAAVPWRKKKWHTEVLYQIIGRTEQSALQKADKLFKTERKQLAADYVELYSGYPLSDYEEVKHLLAIRETYNQLQHRGRRRRWYLHTFYSDGSMKELAVSKEVAEALIEGGMGYGD